MHISVRAMVSICCSPPDRNPARRSRSVGELGKELPRRVDRPAPRRAAPRCARPRGSRCTVRSANTRRSSGTKPMPARAMRSARQPLDGIALPHAPRPCAGGVEAHDRAHHRGLADAVAPEQAHALPALDGERHAEQRARQPVVRADRVDLEHGAQRRSPEIDAAHLVVRADRLGRAFGDHPALVQHRRCDRRSRTRRPCRAR